MTLFRCSSPHCSFEALVPNAPDGADALKCPTCGQMAVAEIHGRPAFRCERCRHVFRNSGSTRDAENCEKCSGRAPRITFGAAKQDVGGQPQSRMVVLSRAEMKQHARALAKAFWESKEIHGTRIGQAGVCDYCDESQSAGEGFLTGPMNGEDTTPSLTCEGCFERYKLKPWDGDTSRMPDDLAMKYQTVVNAVDNLSDPSSSIAQNEPDHLTSLMVETAPTADGPLSLMELARLAARRRWQEPDLTKAVAQGSRKCDTCENAVSAGMGCLMAPVPPRAPSGPVAVSPEIRSINDKLQAIWRQLRYSTGQCDQCGLQLITGGGSGGGLAGMINVMVGMQNMNPQATAAAIALCGNYFGETFAMPENVLFMDMALSSFAGLDGCENCGARLCRRCRKLPHDDGRCTICSAAATGGPRIVCTLCYHRHDKSAAAYRTLAAIWAGRADLADPTSIGSISCLVNAITEGSPDIASTAEHVLRTLSNQKAIDALAVCWLNNRHSKLTQIISEGAYIAEHPAEARVRTALLSKHPESILANDGPEILDPLFKVAKEIDESATAVRMVFKQNKNREIRKQISERAWKKADPLAMELELAAPYLPPGTKLMMVLVLLGASYVLSIGPVARFVPVPSPWLLNFYEPHRRFFEYKWIGSITKQWCGLWQVSDDSLQAYVGKLPDDLPESDQENPPSTADAPDRLAEVVPPTEPPLASTVPSDSARLEPEPEQTPSPPPTNAAEPEMRTWTDRAGRTVVAKMMSFADGTVTFERQDGSTARFALDRLSDEDQQYVRQRTTGFGAATNEAE